MIYQFEGKTEKEAIENAARELGLTKDKFDVEIVEEQKGGIFKKGFVKINVHIDDAVRGGERLERQDRRVGDARLPCENDFEKQLVEFVQGMVGRMGVSAKTSVQFREEGKVGLVISSDDSAQVIGKKGKNLDALQVLANIYSGRINKDDIRIVLDSENYRLRREENLVRMAYSVADRVRTNRSSILLEPMNPFERRIIHTALADINDVYTRSEGSGTFKQVRVSYRGSRR